MGTSGLACIGFFPYLQHCYSFTCYVGNITNAKHLEMNYANYDERILIPYKIKLMGHPFGIKNPSDITIVTDLCTLRTALKAGDCKWVRLTQAEVDAHAKDIDARRGEGEVVGKPRKKRSDAGVPRGSRKRPHTDENDKNIDPFSTKKCRVTAGSKHAGAKTTAAKQKVAKKTKSKEIVECDSDEEPST